MDYIKENAMIQYLTSKVCGYLSHNEYVLTSFLTLQNNPIHAVDIKIFMMYPQPSN